MAAVPVLTEIMYHPSGTNRLDEWFELWNPGGTALDLTGWQASRGVRLAFPDGTAIPANGRLVVAADAATFTAKHPGVGPVVGGWAGMLSDDGETMEIRDAQGKIAIQVAYAPDGDWAVRRLGAPDGYGRRGWEWYALHDGGGRSLELVNPLLPIGSGENWASSAVDGGTPGAPNSVAASDVAPLISEVRHVPAVPGSADIVTVSARLVDEASTGFSAVLHWRADGAGVFAEEPMMDNGANRDGPAGDGIFAARIPAHAVGTVVEFYVTAQDAGGKTRTYPAFEATAEQRSPYLVYQVDAGDAAGPGPVFRLIVPPSEKTYLEREVWGGQPNSDAEVNGTFISTGGIASPEGTTLVRYQCGIRNRGHGTRTSVPHNFRVDFTRDRLWQGRSGLNLNSQHTLSQVLGSAVSRAVGLPMADSRLVGLRWNGADLASQGSPQFGGYAANELVNGTLVERQVPLDPDGNLYRGIRDVVPGVPADLQWRGTDPLSYTNAYFKQNNAVAGDWSDFIHLVDVLNNTPAGEYPAAVSGALNVREWMRYYALNTLLDNQETALGTGAGDDYVLFRGVNDSRFQVWPYDMDSVVGRGLSTVATGTGLFKMADLPVNARLVREPGVAPIYFQELRALIDELFTPERFDAFLDALRAQWPASPQIDAAVLNMMAYNASRVATVEAMIPSSLTLMTALPVRNGYPQSLDGTAVVTGTADAAITAAVDLNGVRSLYTPWQGRWTNSVSRLHPGLNRLEARAMDASGAVVGRATLDVWYEAGSATEVPATLAADTRWTAAGGPYRVAAGLTIEAGATLTVEPGTTVYLGEGANLTVAVGGRMLAEGTEDAPIRFSREPASTARWGGIVIDGAGQSPETRITHARIEYNGRTAIHSAGGSVFLDALTFGSTDTQYVSLDDASFVVSHCVFPTATAGFELVHGTGGIRAGGVGIIRRNYFGSTIGYNDVIDFTGGNRPGDPIAQFVENVFTGGTDDALDLDGTDAWVEGNLFLHIHRNGAPDSSAAVSGGNNSGQTSEVTIVRNLFFDCDNACTAKQGNFFTLLHNTIVHITRVGGVDFASGVVNVRDTTPDVTTPGRGFYLEGNVIAEVESLVRNPDPSAIVTFVDNLLPVAWDGPGSGNREGDPLFVHLPAVDEARFDTWEDAQVLKSWLSLRPGSSARNPLGTGRDWGALIPPGAWIDGAPTGTNRADSATLVVGFNRSGNGIPTDGFPSGSGYTGYRWRLDDGAWSDEMPIGAPIQLSSLSPGPHRVDVVGRKDTGLFQDDPRFGEDAVVTASPIWWVDPNGVPPVTRPTVRLNELDATRPTAPSNPLEAPDWIELHNPGSKSVDLSDMSLTDSPAEPRKFVFGPSTILEPGAYLVVLADNGGAGGGLHTGFALDADGDQVLLYDSTAAGRGLLDAVTFGLQAPGVSLARGSDGTWTAAESTPGAPNVPIPTSGPSALRINEWLARALFTPGGEFVELYNASDLPVALDGVAVFDVPGNPAVRPFGPLSFLAEHAYLRLAAPGAPASFPHRLDFRLDPQGGLLTLTGPGGETAEVVPYGPQRTDISQGRSPDGGSRIVDLPLPTPAAPNPGARAGDCLTETQILPLLPASADWRYEEHADLDGVAWTAADFDDSAWPLGPALLAVESCGCLPTPGLRTPLTLGRNTYYFRSAFVVATNLDGFQLRMTAVVDDGAVVYLNGTELVRVGMTGGTVAYATRASRTVDNAAAETFDLPVDVLVPGTNTLAVEVHQSSSSSSDIVWGAALEAIRTVTNCPSADAIPIVLNEVLARNLSLTNIEGRALNWIELYNPSTNAVSLAGLSLTDDPAQPTRWLFPSDAIIDAHGFYVVPCDPFAPPAEDIAPFALSGNGGELLLFDRAERGGGLLDALRFGVQAADLAAGRVPDGAGWRLAVPSPGAANQEAPVGELSSVRINEWMADPTAGSDWLELFNGDTRPVAVGGMGLTDTATEAFKSILPPLSFLGTGTDAFRQFLADGSPVSGADHLDFQLNRSGESLVLSTDTGVEVDAVVFGAQASGVSEGRLPDGSASVVRLKRGGTPNASNVAATLQDSDGDGLPDEWERAYGLDPANPADADLDKDGDGLSNRDEFAAGTDPGDAASALRIETITRESTAIVVRFFAVAGRTYRVEVRDDFSATGDWRTLSVVSPLITPAEVAVTDPSPSPGARFYRVTIPVP